MRHGKLAHTLTAAELSHADLRCSLAWAQASPLQKRPGQMSRASAASRRTTMIDIGQVLGAFRDCLVVVGGWVPDLLLHAEEPHVRSIDVDLALDAPRLRDGRYAELLKLLLDTRRYAPGERPFQLVTPVDLNDGLPALSVDVDFLAAKEEKLRTPRAKRIPSFRVLQTEGCVVAFRAPVVLHLEGPMVSGAINRVELRVAALPDFLLMKALALGNRDKPKDAYDIAYCLDYAPNGIQAIARAWHADDVAPTARKAVQILRDKFSSIHAFGPQQVVVFHAAPNPNERAGHARRSYELVQRLLSFFPD